jgi:hypothetical protein
MSEQFENSIRKKLQDAEIPFDPDAWEKMKKRLDNPRRRPALFWWILSGLLIFVATGGSFWWWSQQSNSPVTEQRVPVTDSLPLSGTQIKEKESSPASAPNTTTPSAGSPLFVGTPEASANDTTRGTIVDKRDISSPGTTQRAGIVSSSRASQKVSQPPQSSIQQNILSPAIRQSSGQQDSSSSVNKQSSSIARSVQQETSSGLNKQSSNIARQLPNAIKQSANVAEQSSVQQNTSSGADQQSSNTAQQSPAQPDAAPVPQQNSLPRKRTRKGFEGGITIGPDVNIASSMKMGRIGLSTGIILRYHFNNRWSIQTGAIYTKKLYGATPDDYHFDYPVTYTKIDADCNVLDVPLNLSYAFSEGSRDRWSAVAGASSYFMLNEKYDYYYANGTKRSHEFKNQNQHYFSVLNLGVSWERQTAGRLRLALQPYVKVPLGGVGQGKVKLYSAGLALQVTMGNK